MGTFICFFITTKMSYILTLLLPLFPKGCQHQSHYNTTARGNFFPPSHIISSNDSAKRGRTWIQKLLVKEQCSVMWAREAFLNACQSLPLLLTDSSTGTAWICLGTGGVCCAWHWGWDLPLELSIPWDRWQVHGLWDRAPYPTFVFHHISYMRAQRLYQSVLVTQSLVNKN